MSFHFYGEPLLHPDLTALVRCVTVHLPNVRQVLYTNGDLLTEELYAELRTSGIKRFIVTSHDNRPISERPDQVVLFPSELNLTNRGGTVEVGNPPSVRQPLAASCFVPSSILIVTVTGEILLCYEDARRTECMGNIVDEHIEDIWFGNRFQRIRNQLAKGDRTAASVCTLCNNISHLNAETYDFRP